MGPSVGSPELQNGDKFQIISLVFPYLTLSSFIGLQIQDLRNPTRPTEWARTMTSAYAIMVVRVIYHRGTRTQNGSNTHYLQFSVSVPLADFDTTINWSYVVDVCSRLARQKQIEAGTFVVSHSYKTPQTRLRRLYTRKNESRCEGVLLLPSGRKSVFELWRAPAKRPCVPAAPSPPERWQEYFQAGQTSGQFAVMPKCPSKTFSSTSASYGRYRPPAGGHKTAPTTTQQLARFMAAHNGNK